MAMMYHINQTYDLLPASAFYNPDINTSFNLRNDYTKWKSLRVVDLSLAAFPFLLSPTTKAALLKLDAVVTMRAEVKVAQYQTLFVGVRVLYLKLSVRRDHVVRDTFVQLASVSAAELRKQLKVQFVGEVAVDAGGVQKEWLHLVMRNVVAPECGMFVPAGNHGVWFRPWVGTPVLTEVLEEYELIGKLVGLAVFHSILINVPFPLALYKKLANERVTLAELTEIDPDLGKGLVDPAAYEGNDLEDVYCRNFTVGVPTQYGCTVMVRATYDGFTADSPVIQLFVAGSDRSPVRGLARLLVIVRAGADSDRVPSAHVCFDALLLPEYAERDKLRQKLLAAIANGEGIGLR
ncbi:hypothetical protein AMAG_00964 [Allomyces macrogynus ATCC 38327]|uniref:HECT-type E3 ubiquitin transferase n=1 Tax=Allomyces macrogynus (strain ATCC 38327) TaxID=578462 RepID=A0A0L0RYA8_ALLM3|nr:hypothetical protein AMAG_00964 [Allomyces macrogynus ATCC 38327]|eukprot:KNE55026.1 hypothetical protein AMAG_00964 [Allomyces macrogynus ATCC 38327]